MSAESTDKVCWELFYHTPTYRINGWGSALQLEHGPDQNIMVPEHSCFVFYFFFKVYGLFQNLKQKAKERSLQSGLSTVLGILNNLGITVDLHSS